MKKGRMKKRWWILVLLGSVTLGLSFQGWAQATKDPIKPAESSITNAQGKHFFQFAGGDFNQFMTKLGAEFGKQVVDLIEVRDGNINGLRVPKMRFQMSRPGDIREVFLVYNIVSREGNGFLGKWIYFPSQTGEKERQEADTIIFTPPKAGGSDGTVGIQVRAFSVRFLSQERLKALNEVIDKESRQLQRDIAERSGEPSSAEGRVTVHEGTYLLVASGGKMYVELVATLVDAFMTSLEKNGPRQP